MKQLSKHHGQFVDYQVIFKELKGINKKVLDEELLKLEDRGDIYQTGEGMTYGITN